MTEVSRDGNGAAWQYCYCFCSVGYCLKPGLLYTQYQSTWVKTFFINKNMPQDAIDAFAKEGLNRNLWVLLWYYRENKDNLDPGFYDLCLQLILWLVASARDHGLVYWRKWNMGDRKWFKDKVISCTRKPNQEKFGFGFGCYRKEAVWKKRNDPDATCSTLMSSNCARRRDGPDYIKAFSKRAHANLRDAIVHEYWEQSTVIERIMTCLQKIRKWCKNIIWLSKNQESGGKNQIAAWLI